MTTRFPPPTRRSAGFAAAALASAGLLLAACGFGGPPPVTYVLGAVVPAKDSRQPLLGRPVIQVQRVIVPDYLDVTDILIRRSANALERSQTGRWGERLSVGITGALVSDLARDLPDDLVTAEQPLDTPQRQVLVTVETFEPRADGSVVLVARWRITDGDGRSTLAAERLSLTDQAGSTSDAAVTAAMSRLVDRLAERIAAATGPVASMDSSRSSAASRSLRRRP